MREPCTRPQSSFHIYWATKDPYLGRFDTKQDRLPCPTLSLTTRLVCFRSRTCRAPVPGCMDLFQASKRLQTPQCQPGATIHTAARISVPGTGSPQCGYVTVENTCAGAAV